jgi:hypothetical protein
MKPSEIKDLLISSLDADADPREASLKLESSGVSYDFGSGFNKGVLKRIFTASDKVKREREFVRKMNFAFRSIAISGVAAIIFLLISIFIMEGSISFRSLLGLKDNYDESIVCLLTEK